MKKILFLILSIITLGSLFACKENINKDIANKNYLNEAFKNKISTTKPTKIENLKGEFQSQNSHYRLYKSDDQLFLVEASGKIIDLTDFKYDKTKHSDIVLKGQYLRIYDSEVDADLIFSLLTGEKILELKRKEVIGGNTITYNNTFNHQMIMVEKNSSYIKKEYYFKDFKLVEKPLDKTEPYVSVSSTKDIEYYENNKLYDIIKLPNSNGYIRTYILENKNLFIKSEEEVKLGEGQKATDLSYDYYYVNSGKVTRVRVRQYIYNYKIKELIPLNKNYIINAVNSNTKDIKTGLKKYNDNISNFALYNEIDPKTKTLSIAQYASIDNFGNIKKQFSQNYNLVYFSNTGYYIKYHNFDIRTIGKNSKFFESRRIVGFLNKKYAIVKVSNEIVPSYDLEFNLVNIYDLEENKYILNNYYVIKKTDNSALLKNDKGEYFFFFDGKLKKIEGKLDNIYEATSGYNFVALFKNGDIISVYNLFGDEIAKYDITKTKDFNLEIKKEIDVENKNNTKTRYYLIEITYKNLDDSMVKEFYTYSMTYTSFDLAY